MARTKVVNGVRVPLTVAEETQRDAEELAFQNRPSKPKPVDVLSELIDALIGKSALALPDFSADARAEIADRKAGRR